jgi:uncharacterized membrane protein YhaH (DUF805 family)
MVSRWTHSLNDELNAGISSPHETPLNKGAAMKLLENDRFWCGVGLVIAYLVYGIAAVLLVGVIYLIYKTVRKRAFKREQEAARRIAEDSGRPPAPSLDNSEVTEIEKNQPLKAPRIGFLQAVKSGFQNIFVLNARSTRAEVWWWILFYVLLGAAFGIVLVFFIDLDDEAAWRSVDYIDNLIWVLLIPSWVSLNVRRLHDLNRSGWLVLANFLPFLLFGDLITTLTPVFGFLVAFRIAELISLIVFFWLLYVWLATSYPKENRWRRLH